MSKRYLKVMTHVKQYVCGVLHNIPDYYMKVEFYRIFLNSRHVNLSFSMSKMSYLLNNYTLQLCRQVVTFTFWDFLMRCTGFMMAEVSRRSMSSYEKAIINNYEPYLRVQLYTTTPTDFLMNHIWFYNRKSTKKMNVVFRNINVQRKNT